MDLTRPSRRPAAVIALGAVGAFVALGGLLGCASDTPFELTEDAIPFPATVMDAYVIAERVALDWSEKAYPARLGGEFTVLDAEGRGRNHSFTFFARIGNINQKLIVHMLSGAPYTIETRVPAPDPPFRDIEAILDTDVAVAIAENEMQAWNEAHPDSAVAIPDRFGARLLSVPVWPLRFPGSPGVPDELAWRVDLLVEEEGGDPVRLIWWSLGRVYLDPESGQPLGDPVFPTTGREAYTPNDNPPTGSPGSPSPSLGATGARYWLGASDTPPVVN